MGNAQGVEVVLRILDHLGARGAAEEEGCLGVLDDLGLAVGEGALRAGVLGFSAAVSNLPEKTASYQRGFRRRTFAATSRLWLSSIRDWSDRLGFEALDALKRSSFEATDFVSLKLTIPTDSGLSVYADCPA